MLGKIISQLYRIADLLKDKKLVDKDSNTSSETENENEVRVKPVYNNANLIGVLVKDKDFVHIETEQTTLAQIFPNVINDIIDIINTAIDGGLMFSISVENSAELLNVVTINMMSHKIDVTLDKSELGTSHYYGGGFSNINEIANLQLTQGFEGMS